ncbi:MULTISPECIES: endonuclease/exonuclease/phosphatase family protein [unclassified Streptomyces]|uniref:endonuclease/exonuclease/phosphatase family protein n=1 Tax=unclassified Streptomyces TaxID=2593676 RepID=UPI00369D06EF
MRATLRVLFAALFSIGMIVTSGANPSQADIPDANNWPKPRFITYNICGQAGHCGIYGDSVDAWKNKMIGAIDGWDADVVMLQEVCYEQWRVLRDALQNRSNGPKYDSIWGASLPSGHPNTVGCKKWGGTDTRFGLATFSKGSPGTINNSDRFFKLLTSTAEQRILLCGRTTVTGRAVRACNTHIDPGSDAKRQIGEVAAKVEEYAGAGDPVVLAGDFNRLPHHEDMTPLYNHSGGTGVFQEVDENDKENFPDPETFPYGCAQSLDRCRSGEWTAEPTCSPKVGEPGKIDYIFLSYYWFTTLRGDAAACTEGMSDHHLLRGAAAWEH